MYFDSTEGATVLLFNYAAAISETVQEPWRSLSSLSTSCYYCYTRAKVLTMYQWR